MGKLDMNDIRVYEAIKQGVYDAIWQMITNSTDCPCEDFFNVVREGVQSGIGDCKPTVFNAPEEWKGNYDDNPLLELKDEIIQQCMIREVIAEHIAIQQVGSTQKYKGVCPFHEDHKPSLWINTESQKFECLSCGASGDIVDFVMKIDESTEKEALVYLAGVAGINPEDFLGKSDKKA